MIDRDQFHDPGWYKALTLKERLALIRLAEPPDQNAAVRPDLAQRRMRQWRMEPSFASEARFSERLSSDGLTEDKMLWLLGETEEVWRERSGATPQWLAELAEAFSSSRPEESDNPDTDAEGFLVAVEPLMRRGYERLRREVRALCQGRDDLPFEPAKVADLFSGNLMYRLAMMLNRTMVLELHVARMQRLLQGETSEERFTDFVRRLREPHVAASILHEYPVLARQITAVIDQWVEVNLEFLRHLTADWEDIRQTFSPETEPGSLTRVKSGAGDTHRNGRSVIIAEFSSGLKAVYKPRPSSLDIHFQELLAWLNERGDHPPFRTLKMLDRGEYGWVEFVEAEGCSSGEEVERFYQRQGGYLALLYALEATDFHQENLIAAGEHPVLLDLEALFHPRLHGLDTSQADGLAGVTLGYSVLGVGLLPHRIWANAESEGVDLSGLGGAGGQLSPFGVPQWEAPGTDEMHLIRKRLIMPSAQNQPSLNGSDVSVLDYREALVSGFTRIYGLILKHREELLSEGGPLSRFADDEVRVIVRGTQTYAVLLRESVHPDVLRDALDRDRLFDRLWVTAEQMPQLARLIPAEQADLQRGDIPMFTTRPSSRDIWTSQGEPVCGYFDEPSTTLVQHRLQQLSDKDLDRQLWIIRASFLTLSKAMESATPGSALRRVSRPTETTAPADRSALLTAARAVGDRLESLALRGDQDASWIGLTLTDERHWSLVPLQFDLYDGLPGIALFLGYLGAVTGEERYTGLADATLTTMRQQVERQRSFIKSVGGFDGWGGVIYTLTHLGVLWERPALLAEAESVVELLPELIGQDEHLDIISGSAGCIGSLLSLHRCLPSDRTLAAAVQCGERLLARRQQMDKGTGWITLGARTKPLTGFSHGAAGIVWALLELAALSGDELFRIAALDGIRYERSLFCAETGNWPDLREFETLPEPAGSRKDTSAITWCHGAPGIGLARLLSLQRLDDAAVRAEIDTALNTTLAQGFGGGGGHSMCHGDLGNLELLLQAGQVLGDPKWATHVGRITASILGSISRHGWLCGNQLWVESPGLMTGIAGIGYGLLRLYEPGKIPSVLALEPPMLRSELS